MSTVLMWPVAVDGQTHIIGAGPVVHVDAQHETTVVYVWTLEENCDVHRVTVVQAFGTGQPLPEGATHLGTAVAGPFVWHVFEV